MKVACLSKVYGVKKYGHCKFLNCHSLFNFRNRTPDGHIYFGSGSNTDLDHYIWTVSKFVYKILTIVATTMSSSFILLTSLPVLARF